MSDDIIKRLREAIAAGPTPGPWTVMPANAGEHCVARINAWEAVPPSSCELSSDTVDAAYIAAASPDNIAAMLDRLDAAERERDSKAAELANLQVAFSDWKVFHSTARLEAENERLKIELATQMNGDR